MQRRPGRPAPRGARARTDRRRSAPPRVHVLPSGAVDGGPGRADAEGRVEPLDGGDRTGLPDVREHDGTAAAAGQAEDRQRRHPVPRPARRGAPRTTRRRPRRDLPRLHRGLRDAGRRRAGRRGDPARPAAGRADARRRRGPRAARPDVAAARPAGRPRRRRRAGHAGGPGPLALGHRRHRRGARPRRWSGAPGAAPTASRPIWPPSTPRPSTPARRTGCASSRSTTSCWPSTRHPSSRSTGPWPSA